MNKETSKASTNGTAIAIDFNDIYFLAKEDMYSDLEFLLRKSPELLNIPNKDGISALHFAAGWNRIKSVMILVENGADIKIKDKRLSTPLSYAALRGHTIVVEYLLGLSGCYKLINDLNSLGMTLLHDVCYVGQHNIALKLIEFGGDIRIKDNHGRTCLNCIGTMPGKLFGIDLIAKRKADLENKFSIQRQINQIKREKKQKESEIKKRNKLYEQGC